MRAALAIALTCAPLAAAADPAAHLAVDVDGDGRVDQLAVEAPGQLVVTRGGGGGQLVPFARSGALTEARLTAAGRTVVASARIGGAWEAVALIGGKGGLVEVWRGSVGPAGDDDEYEQWLEARPEGIVRYQTRADQRRCDGGPIELFRERWDERRRGFAATGPVVPTVAAGTPTVTAAPIAALTPTVWYRAVAASQAAGATDAAMLVAPRALGDLDPATAWTAPGDGHGTWWQFRADLRGGKAAALRVVVGDGRHRRAARLLVVGASGAAVVVVPDPARSRTPGTAAYEARLPTALEGCVSVALLDSHAGPGPIAVPELQVIADVELDPRGAVDALLGLVIAGGLAGDTAGRALVALGPAAIAPVVGALATAPTPARPRLYAVLAAIDDPAVVPPLAEALGAGALAPDRKAAAARQLAHQGQAGRGALAALLTTAPDLDGKLAAIAALAEVDPTALVAAAGVGPWPQRTALAQALATAGVAPLVAAAQATADTAAQADLWRAVGLAAARTPAAQAAAQDALVAALASAGKSYELRLRLIAALAPIADERGLAPLTAALGRLPDSAAGRALARVAVRALADNRAPAAWTYLLAQVTASDPGVRLEALRAWGGAPDTVAPPALDAQLARALADDAWPMNRQQAAATLGGRCGQAPVRAALATALDADAETAVRVEAVASLARCPDAATDARLLAVVDDGGQRLPVRDRALAALADRPGQDEAVLARFGRWRSAAFSDDTALRLAVRAATVLGQRATRAAGPALLAAARDNAFPELTAAAVRALGPVCPPEAPALLRSLRTADEPAIALAARAAAAECRGR